MSKNASLFEILGQMNQEEPKSVKMFPIGNVKRINRGSPKKWGDITIAIDPETAGKLLAGTFGEELEEVPMLLVVNWKKLQEVKEKIEAEE